MTDLQWLVIVVMQFSQGLLMIAVIQRMDKAAALGEEEQ